MSSRDDILTSIRANLPGVDRPLPHVPLFDGDPPASLLSAFKESLHRMGGVFLDSPASDDTFAPIRAGSSSSTTVYDPGGRSAAREAIVRSSTGSASWGAAGSKSPR